jgi:hypothetical protein
MCCIPGSTAGDIWRRAVSHGSNMTLSFPSRWPLLPPWMRCFVERSSACGRSRVMSQSWSLPRSRIPARQLRLLAHAQAKEPMQADRLGGILYHALWVEGMDLSDPAVLAQAWTDAGYPRAISGGCDPGHHPVEPRMGRHGNGGRAASGSGGWSGATWADGVCGHPTVL